MGEVERANNAYRIDRMERELNSLLPLTEKVETIDTRLLELESIDLKNRIENSDSYISQLKIRLIDEDENNAILQR